MSDQINNQTRKRAFNNDDEAVPTKKYFSALGNMVNNPQQQSTLPQSDDAAFNRFTTDPTTLGAVPLIHGFQRGYELESILDLFENEHEEHYLYIKFKNLAKPELVPLFEAVEHCHQEFPAFYREYIEAWDKGLLRFCS